jgi:hypothetical protein
MKAISNDNKISIKVSVGPVFTFVTSFAFGGSGVVVAFAATAEL